MLKAKGEVLEALEKAETITEEEYRSLVEAASGAYGVALVEFHTKMNALDDDIFAITSEALDRLENEFDGLVVGNEGDNFSAGANLFMVVVAAQQGMWDQLDGAIRRLQSMNMRMRYSPKPVVVAPAGLALGGGCEVTMHASRVVMACFAKVDDLITNLQSP